MANIKKPSRSKLHADQPVRPRDRSGVRRKQNEETVRRAPPGASVAVVPPPPPLPPVPAPVPAHDFDDSDFGAGIFAPEKLPGRPPQEPHGRRAEPRDEEPKRPAAVEKAEEPGAAALRPLASQDDDESFFASAPEEIEDQTGVVTGEAETDEELIEAAREDSRNAGAKKDQNEQRTNRRRGRGGRRGHRGRRDGKEGDEVRQADRGRPSTSVEKDGDEQADFAAVVMEEPEAGEQEEVEERTQKGRRRGPARDRTPRAEEKEETASAENREMLINVSDADECRIALLRDGRLDELDIERTTSASNVGNIYKGRITNVESSIQAAFIDFGLPVHGFLHISDLHPKYFPESKGENELVGRKTPRRHRPPIQSCLKRGQEVIVQIIKEGIGTKGPTLSTYISLPGRFLVMMPGMEELGVSRKIEDDEQRRKMRDLLAQLDLPKDMGFIMRTAGIDRNKKDLQRDLDYLTRLWSKVAARIKSEPAPAELYRESDLVIRTIRDVFDSSIKRILVDNPAVADRVREFLAIASPKSQDVVEPYDDAEPMFHRFAIETEIDKLHSKHVPLPCGGSLVIEQTEALVAIDVNSGRFRVPENAEETAYRVNVEAADEIARQLRLRDLGGLIICDFIDMTLEKHRRSIERRLADALKQHKERAKLLRISRFGILEMTRQRQRPSFAKSMFAECPRCVGSGRVKATESVCLDVMRQITLATRKEGVASIDVRVSTAVANELLNRKRHALTELERAGGLTIRIHGDPSLGVDQVQLSATDRRGREVPSFSHALPHAAPAPSRPAPAPGAEPRRSGDGGRRRGRRGGRGGRHGGRGNGGARRD